MIFVLIALGLLVVLALAAIGIYNGLVKQRNLSQEAWRQIDVELTRRHDLIGNLVETVKGYAAHERGTLEDVVRARAAAMAPGQSPAAQAASETVLTQALGRLIASARRYYNATVRDLNTKVETFPNNILAGMFGIGRAEYFEAEETSREAPKVDFGQREHNIPAPQSYTGTEAPAAPAAPAPGVENPQPEGEIK